MKKLSAKLLEAAMFTLLVAACLVSAGQMTAKAQVDGEVPLCHGLECWDASDCGSKCFCNRPSSTCYSDQELEQ